jgi:hypothetical protein
MPRKKIANSKLPDPSLHDTASQAKIQQPPDDKAFLSVPGCLRDDELGDSLGINSEEILPLITSTLL